jgi:arsenate reductase-like glutaredoxin family protein
MNEISIDDAVVLHVPELEKLLGVETARKQLAARPPTDDELRRLGRKQFDRFKPLIQKKICDNKQLREIFDNETDEKVLIIAIMDAAAAILTGVALVLVSALIVKIGLKYFCNS